MSLGSPFGSKDDPSAVASTNAAKAGVIVVTSAGNSGPNQYITGSPGTGDGSISTAANDRVAGLPGRCDRRQRSRPAARRSRSINANGATLRLPTPADRGAAGQPGHDDRHPGFLGSSDESLGCSPSRTRSTASLPADQIAVAQRGACARVAKAIFGQQAGRPAV